MKKILAILALCFIVSVCKSQDIKIYPFYADGVVEFNYLVQEDIYYIVYRDTTHFPDVYYDDNDEWYEEVYLSLKCSKKDFFDYLEWFSKELENRTDAFYKPNPIYRVVEVRKKVKGGINYQYELVRKKV